ncbi:hypothetical protein RJ639_035942, partial [Escallonia herrerae]
MAPKRCLKVLSRLPNPVMVKKDKLLGFYSFTMVYFVYVCVMHFFYGKKERVASAKKSLWGTVDVEICVSDEKFGCEEGNGSNVLGLPLYLPRRLTIPAISEERWSRPFAIRISFFVEFTWDHSRHKSFNFSGYSTCLANSIGDLVSPLQYNGGLGLSLVFSSWSVYPSSFVIPRDPCLYETMGFLIGGLLWALVMLPKKNTQLNHIGFREEASLQFTSALCFYNLPGLLAGGQ